LSGNGTTTIPLSVVQNYVTLTNTQTISGSKTFFDQVNLNNNKIVNLAEPASSQDAATKYYVDTLIAATSGQGSGGGSAFISGTLGVAVSAGQPVYQKESDGLWYLAQATTTQITNLSITVASGASGSIINFMRYGNLTGLSGLPANSELYLSQTSAGILTSIAPTTGVIAFIGISRGTTILDVAVGEVAFQSAASGSGGSTLELLETKSHLEKSVINYPISAIHGINESFTDTSNVTITPRKAYVSGTTFVFDINKTDIDLMEATTGWTGGKTTGTSATLATDTTAGERVQGSASNKLTISAVSDLAWMIKNQTVFSLVDQYFTLSMYLDNVPAALTKISIRLSSTAGGATNYKQYDILAANLVAGAGTFNHFSIDPTNDTADSSNGTYVVGATIATNIYFTFSGSSTMLAAADFLVRQPNWRLPLPMSYYIWDTTNQERLAIASVAGTGYYQRNIYTITALSNGYAVDAAYAKERNVTISNNQATFTAGQAGAVALTTYDQTTTWFPDTVTGKTINMSQRFLDEERKITALTSSTETKIYCATDLKAHYLSGDKVILYNKTWNGRKYNSFYNATVGANFKLVTLTANASYSGTDILLTHAGENNTGMSVGNWYAVRYSAEMLYKLEAETAGGALSVLTPSIFSPDIGGKKLVLTENWTNANTSSPTLYNNWTGVVIGTGGVLINSNTLYFNGNADEGGYAYRNYEQCYSLAGIKQGLEIATEFQNSGNNNTAVTFYFALGGNTTSGDGLRVSYIGSTGVITVVDTSGTLTTATVATQGRGVTKAIKIKTENRNIKVYFGGSIATLPTTPDINFTKLTDFTVSGEYLKLITLSSESGGNEFMDNLTVYKGTSSYIARGTVDSQTGSKLTTATKLTRSAAAQDPIIYQREAEVV
jgi:hypothetical protein